jgi:stage III sporulation protein AG
MFDSIKNKFGLTKTEDEGNKGRKKKIENIVFLIIILIITVIIINNVWSEDSEKSKEQSDKVLAKVLETDSAQEITGYYTLQQNLENILETMEGVGKVKVLINYAETSTTVAVYNETKTESTTEEKDTEGGTRNVTQTDTQKEIAYTRESGESAPITEKIIMPTIEGAVITAEGASNANIKANIISATQAVTGLAAHKIQVFQMQKK